MIRVHSGEVFLPTLQKLVRRLSSSRAPADLPAAADADTDVGKNSTLGALYHNAMSRHPFIANGAQAALINALGVVASSAIPVLNGSNWKPVNWTEVRKMHPVKGSCRKYLRVV